MSWRTVVITQRAKLDMKNGYLVVRTEDEQKRVHLDEISVLMIENSAVSITGCLLAELMTHKIKTIFCDEKRNPAGELVPYYGSHDCSGKLRKQIKWTDDVKASVWTEIVSEKIRQQAAFLKELNRTTEAEMLYQYLEELEFNDESNREGHAAKVYFNALFGMQFTRSTDCVTNAALNYGYSILLSAFNRECTALGYSTQLGLFHNNQFNHFNLSCDLMETFRVLVDREVVKQKFCKFESEEKHILVGLLNQNVVIDSNVQYVMNAIKIYCRSVFDAISDFDMSEIRFYALEKP